MSGGTGTVSRPAGHRSVRVRRISDDLPVPQTLTVMARHARAITALDQDRRVVTILASGRAAGPRALVVDRIDRLPDRVRVDMHAPADAVVSPDTERFATRIHPQWTLDRATLRTEVEDLRSDAPESSLWAMLSTGHPFAGRLVDFWRWLADGSGPAPLVAGFGTGSTPSSDDYLVGVHSVLTCIASPLRGPLSRLLAEQGEHTTPLSGAMFDAALQGRYPEALLELFRRPGRRSVQALRSHGHASGFDMAAGVLTALAY